MMFRRPLVRSLDKVPDGFYVTPVECLTRETFTPFKGPVGWTFESQ